MTAGRRSRHRLLLATLAAVVGLLVVLPATRPARAQETANPQDASSAEAEPGESLDVEVERAEFPEDRTNLTVRLEGVAPDEFDPASFTVTDDGQEVPGVEVERASTVGDVPAQSVMLVMDTSDSTEGEPRERSIAAATQFADAVTERGIAVGVLAFHGEVEPLLEPTQDAAAVRAALDDMPGGRFTVLYDAVAAAAATLADLDGQRTLVVFTDGADQGSGRTLADAIRIVEVAGASVDTVALQTRLLDTDALEALASNSGGRVIEVADEGGLQEAFATVAEDLDSRFLLGYPSTDSEGEVGIEVAYERDGTRSADTLDVVKQTTPSAAEPEVVRVESPGAWASPSAATGAVVAAGVGVALLLLALFVPAGDRQVARTLQVAVGGAKATSTTAPRQDLSPTTAALSRRATELVERIPKPEGYDAQLQLRIDRAAWPLRSTEFTTLRSIMALVGLGLGWSLANLEFGLVLAVAGWVVPNVVLSVRVNARQKLFMDQLPDTLQLISGSLKAGYGVLQAIDTVVKETSEPTKSEFQRVLTEARLGLPLDDSLMDMADRIGAEDFRWVAVSISIQRRVGGNLAKLLETVAATLRERASTRRQISSLSAEGRLSAVVLIVLPFGLAGWMYISNPGYLSPLWTSSMGQVMLVGATVLMAGGIYVMKNMVEIDV